MAAKVLIIDDSLTVRRQVAGALISAGYEVIEAADGVEGLAQISATPDLAVAICDLHMPRMGGIELMETVRTGPRRDLPIITLTAEGHGALIRRAAQSGVKAWIVKPFKADMLVATVDMLVRRRRPGP